MVKIMGHGRLSKQPILAVTNKILACRPGNKKLLKKNQNLSPSDLVLGGQLDSEGPKCNSSMYGSQREKDFPWGQEYTGKLCPEGA